MADGEPWRLPDSELSALLFERLMDASLIIDVLLMTKQADGRKPLHLAILVVFIDIHNRDLDSLALRVRRLKPREEKAHALGMKKCLVGIEECHPSISWRMAQCLILRGSKILLPRKREHLAAGRYRPLHRRIL